MRSFAIIAGAVAFAVLLSLRDLAPTAVWRAVVAGAAGACLGVAFLYLGRR
jgi:hypothetical protein